MGNGNSGNSNSPGAACTFTEGQCNHKCDSSFNGQCIICPDGKGIQDLTGTGSTCTGGKQDCDAFEKQYCRAPAPAPAPGPVSYDACTFIQGQCDFPCSSYSTFGMTTYCQACVGGYVTSQDNGKGTCSNPQNCAAFQTTYCHTPAPTPAPTLAPTLRPTPAPTVGPTPVYTRRPTTAPTVVPYAGYSPHSQSKGNPKRALVVGMSALAVVVALALAAGLAVLIGKRRRAAAKKTRALQEPLI
jgi:hypothetical protein